MARDKQNRLYRIAIPVPNPAISAWLKGPRALALVESRTVELYSIYVSHLPVRTGNLRKGAYYRVGRGGFGREKDRWMGWVGNSALSYRKTTGRPYAGRVEWGKNGVGGAHTLYNAGALITGRPIHPSLRNQSWERHGQVREQKAFRDEIEGGRLPRTSRRRGSRLPKKR